MDVAIAEALWCLDELPAGAVEGIAVEALMQGLDGPALRELAWPHADWAAIGDLFGRALQEMGRPPITKQEAITRLIRREAARIVSGEVEPFAGARDLFYRVWRHVERWEDYESMTDMLRWANVFDEDPVHREAFKEKIVQRAQALLDHDPVALSRALPGWSRRPPKHGQVLRKDDALLMVLDLMPEFQRRWVAYLDEWLRGDGQAEGRAEDRESLCLFMMELARFVGDRLLSRQADRLQDLFASIDRLVAEGDQEVQSAVATCFLEGLLHRTVLPPERYVSLLGPASVAYCRAWDEFTGVRTPGLW